MAEYQIFTDATSDLTKELLAGLPSVEIIPMQVEVEGKEYTYGPEGNITVKEFYAMQREGHFASTSQINPSVFYQCFKPYLQRGKDIIYLAFSSGMSGTIYSAQMAIIDLKEEYPDREIVYIDTLCASVGEGFLVRETARKQAEGMDLKSLVLWIDEHRMKVCHWFTVDTLEHLKHGGRVSAASAAIGTVLNIKPLLHVGQTGALQVVSKPRGRRKAMDMQLAQMSQGWQPEISPYVLIGHGDCPEEAELLKIEVQKKFPEAEIAVTEIDPIIGAHTGPGMLALIYWGNTR